jgi:hypothetical protein
VRADAAGAGETLRSAVALVESAAGLGPETPAGAAALALAERMCTREARRLTRRAEALPPAEAAELERVAHEFFARAVAIRRVTETTG